MPAYLINIEVWKSLWPILLGVFGLALLIAFLTGKRHERWELFFVILAFSMVGMVTGYLAGFSRAPALGTVLPAVLSLIGGLVVYLIGKNAESRFIVSISMFVFSLTLLMGAEWGAVMRATAEEIEKSEMHLKHQAFIEAEVNKFRKKLDLPPLPSRTEQKRP